jgi:uncharacterized protein
MDLQVVVKVSKHCNLRCTYCYETPWLGERARIELTDLEILFHQTLGLISYAASPRRRIRFYWQGGEPFLQPISYWQGVRALQDEVFKGSGVTLYNEIQSNATLITERHLPLLRQEYTLGLSFDVYNGERKTASGKDVSAAVVSKLDWLMAEGIPLAGVIAVISAANADRLPSVAEFFLSRGLDFRLLNIYTGIDALTQIGKQAVPVLCYLEGCRDLLRSPQTRTALDVGLSIEPLTTALRQLQAYRRRPLLTPDPDAEREWVLLVDTNGDLYSPGFAYDPRYCYGNIFRDTLESLLLSEGRARRIRESQSRLDTICRHCFLFRNGCDGSFVAHCTPEEARAFAELKTCYYGWLADAAAKDELQCNSV